MWFPVHETLDKLIPVGEEEQFASLDHSQQSFLWDLEDWARRVQLKLAGLWMCLALWGDAAPYNKRDQVYLLTYRLLSGEYRSRIWIFCLSKRDLCQCGCFGRCTFDSLFEAVAWSMKQFLSGTWPTHDREGNALKGWRGALGRAKTKFRFGAAFLKKCGDWAWQKQVLGMRGWSSKVNCWQCQMSMDCLDFTDGAWWKKTQVSMEAYTYMMVAREVHTSAIFSIPGSQHNMIIPDWMHCVCRGILQYYMGCVMRQLFTAVKGMVTKPKQGCTKLYVMICTAARSLNLEKPFWDLTFTMFQPGKGKHPRMRLKAAESRYFLPVLLQVLRLFSLRKWRSNVPDCSVARLFAVVIWNSNPGTTTRRP